MAFLDDLKSVCDRLAGRIRVSLTAEVQSEELIARHQAYNACDRALNNSASDVCLVVVRKINDWSAVGAGRPELTGGGYLMEFAKLTGNQKTTSEKNGVRRRVQKRHICQFGANGIAYKDGGTAFVFMS